MLGIFGVMYKYEFYIFIVDKVFLIRIFLIGRFIFCRVFWRFCFWVCLWEVLGVVSFFVFFFGRIWFFVGGVVGLI